MEVNTQPVLEHCQSNATEFKSVLQLNVRNTGMEAISPPYTFSLQNLEYLAASEPFNVDLSSSQAVEG